MYGIENVIYAVVERRMDSIFLLCIYMEENTRKSLDNVLDILLGF